MTSTQKFGLMLFILGQVAYWAISGVSIPVLIIIFIGGLLFMQEWK